MKGPGGRPRRAGADSGPGGVGTVGRHEGGKEQDRGQRFNQLINLGTLEGLGVGVSENQ